MLFYHLKLKLYSKDLKWTLRFAALGVILFLYLVLRVVGNIIFHHTYTDYLVRSLEGPIPYNDPALIHHIREKILEPPSSMPYALNTRWELRRKLGSELFYDKFTKLLFESQKNGFFVEAGALDGQSMSNTLWLEQAMGWNGLLVEPDPANYIALKRKHRKSWTAKACLSMYDYPNQESLSSLDIVLNKYQNHDIKYRSMGAIVRQTRNNTFLHKAIKSDEIGNAYYIGQCLPLASFLVALNITRVDLLSLDVEGLEENIIKNFDFNKFQVDVLFMEWGLSSKLEWLRLFMDSKGFMFVANEPRDIIFVRKNSKMAKIVTQKIKKREFTYYVPKN